MEEKGKEKEGKEKRKKFKFKRWNCPSSLHFTVSRLKTIVKILRKKVSLSVETVLDLRISLWIAKKQYWRSWGKRLVYALILSRVSAFHCGSLRNNPVDLEEKGYSKRWKWLNSPHFTIGRGQSIPNLWKQSYFERSSGRQSIVFCSKGNSSRARCEGKTKKPANLRSFKDKHKWPKKRSISSYFSVDCWIKVLKLLQEEGV